MGNCNNFDINNFDINKPGDPGDYESFFKCGRDRRPEWENFESPWRNKNDAVTVLSAPQKCVSMTNGTNFADGTNCANGANGTTCANGANSTACANGTGVANAGNGGNSADKTRVTSGIIYMSNIGSGDFPPGTAVTFNQQPVPIFPILGMSRVSASTVRLTLPGEYKVDYFFRPQYSVTAMALFINDREVPASKYEALTPSEKLTGTATFVLSPSDVPVNLTLRNVHSKNAALNPGMSPKSVDASMTVTAIAY